MAAVGVQTYRLDGTQKEFASYKTEVELLNKINEDKFNKGKKTADADKKKLASINADLAKRLLAARTQSNYLPETGATASSGDTTHFNRTELIGAIRQLDEGISRLLEEGDSARLDLNIVKEWARNVTN